MCFTALLGSENWSLSFFYCLCNRLPWLQANVPRTQATGSGPEPPRHVQHRPKVWTAGDYQVEIYKW